DFGSATREQRKEFLYMHLYYSKVQPEALRKALDNAADYPTMGSYARSAIFGHERVTPALAFRFKPIEANEIQRETQLYQTYTNTFSREQAARRPITYAVIPIEENFDFSNLDRWYQRDEGQRVGDYVLYRLKLRSEE